MRIGTSKADRAGFFVFLALAILLVSALLSRLGGDPVETSQDVSTFADLPETTTLATAVPTTAPIDLPTATPRPLPTATPTPDVEPEAATPDGDTTDDVADRSDDSSTADTAGQSGAAAGSDSSQATAAANPQPRSTATSAPNPQPKSTTAANPQPAAVDVPAPAPAGGTFTHTLTSIVAQPTLHSTAGGSAFMPAFNGLSLPPVNPTVFGNALVYRVLAGSPGDAWAQVLVPARPNGTTAWVQTSQFRWGSSNRKIVINIGNNTVTVYEGDSVLLTTSAVTGKGSSRTPVANGWVEEIMPGPSGAYGPTLISLGLFSNDLNSFGGSVPKIALHGTNNPSLMGQYASNGCIRVRNEIITQIAGLIVPGSRVEIVG